MISPFRITLGFLPENPNDARTCALFHLLEVWDAAWIETEFDDPIQIVMDQLQTLSPTPLREWMLSQVNGLKSRGVN